MLGNAQLFGICTAVVQQANSAIATTAIQGYLSSMTCNEITFIESFLPPWCEPGSKPEWLTTRDGGGICVWTRDVGTAVWLAREDTIDHGGQVRRGPTLVRFNPEAGDAAPTPVAARGWAAELVAAAELADLSTDSQPR